MAEGAPPLTAAELAALAVEHVAHGPCVMTRLLATVRALQAETAVLREAYLEMTAVAAAYRLSAPPDPFLERKMAALASQAPESPPDGPGAP